MQSKSRRWNRICLGKDTVAWWSCLSPHPAFANVIVVEVSPKVVFSSLGQRPVPAFFNVDFRAIHVIHVVSVGEGGHFSIGSKGILTHSSSCDIAIDFESSNWIGEGNDTSSPSFIEGTIRVTKWGIGWVELIEGTI